MDKVLNIQRHQVIALLLAVVTLAAYWQVLNNGFTNYDDGEYVTGNPYIQAELTLDSIIWAFTSGYASNWHPLTWISHMLDYQLFGLNAWGHHLMNLLLHIANTVLLFYVLSRMTGALWQSAFVAALFALHPLHVESVAWAAERKDVLSTLFWILTMFAYVRYVEKPGMKRYVLVLLVFALGLMAKPMLVTLPFVLLLLDYWPLGRFQVGTDVNKRQIGNIFSSSYRRSLLFRVTREKIPMFGLVVLSSVITFLVQQRAGAVAITDLFSINERIANAINSYGAYIVKMIWPINLAVFYPHPEKTLAPLQVSVAGLFLVAATALAFWKMRRRPYLVTGWLWYIGTLVPVIGLVQVGEQAMADRYTYVPILGIFMILAWGIPELLVRWRYRTVGLSIAGGVLLLALTVRTWSQVEYWQDTFTLLGHAIDVTTNNWAAHNNLGTALAGQKRFDEARAHYEEVIRLKPAYAAPHYNLGLASAEEGKIDEAIAHYNDAVRLNPNYADAHHNLGLLLAGQGKTAEAMEHYRKTLQIDPNHEKSHYALANLLAAEGKNAEAIIQYKEVLRINPNAADARVSLGIMLLKDGKTTEAIAQYSEALRINPNSSDAHNNMGVALGKLGKTEEAIMRYREALVLNPDHADAHNNLGLLLAEQGKVAEARAHFSEGLRINPEYIEAQNNLAKLPAGEGKIADAKVYYNMGIAFAAQGRIAEAITQYSEALRLKPDYAEVHNNLGAILGKQGKLNEAIAHLLEALRLDPNNPDAHNNLGITLAVQGKTADAIFHFSEVVRLNPNHLSAHYNLGLLLARQGKLEEAIKEYRAALRIKPDYAEARKELERVRELQRKGKPIPEKL